MRYLGQYITSKGNKYVLEYFEDTKEAEAIALPKTVGSRGSPITKKIAPHEDPKEILINALEEGNY